MAAEAENDYSLISKLKFSKKFYGRQQELARLERSYSRLCTKTKRSEATSLQAEAEVVADVEETVVVADVDVEIVMVSGYSGSGKSALVHKFKANRKRQTPFLFVSGKYDELKGADPYSAIVEAFSGFCSEVVKGNPAALERVRADIINAVGSEGKVLTDIIPDLIKVIGIQQEPPFVDSKENELNRLKFIFRNFVRVICTEKTPVVIFFDDLQWSDEASLDLLTDLLTDNSIHYMMFVGAFRANEVNEDHELSKRLCTIESYKNVERINLLNLSIDSIGDFIADTLNRDQEETRSLAEVVYGKTQGNIFFTRQSLDELQRKKMLCYSLATFKWEWELNRIELEAGMSDNVAEAVAAKLQSLPDKLQRALTIAAFTRSTFDINTLHVLMEAEGCSTDRKELSLILEAAILEGLLQTKRGSQHYYKFAHDRILEAVYSLVPAGDERDQIRVRIGTLLVKRAHSEEGEDWMLFVAADHLNSVPSQNNVDGLELARLNLEVGEKAVGVSAFVPASRYLQKGLDALEMVNYPWRSCYNLALRLHRAAADVELCLGNFELGRDLSEKIFQNAVSVQDKLPSSLSLANALGRHERHAEAFELCKKALFRLGEFPRRFHIVHLLGGARSVKRFFQKHTDDEILRLPLMIDKNKLIAMKFLTELGLRAFQCDKMPIVFLCIIRLLHMTFQFGICDRSAQAFAAYGMLLGGPFRDQEMANRMGKLARTILEITKGKHMEALTLYTVACFIDGWRAQRAQVLETFQRALKAGMECGDFENSFRARGLKNIYAFLAGYPLGPIEKSSCELCHQCQHYGVDSILAMEIPFRFLLLHLMGKTRIDWKKIREEPLQTLAAADSSDTFRLISYYQARAQIAYYFGELELAERMARKLCAHSKPDLAYTGTTIRVFFCGLIGSALARKTGRTKYKRQARQALKEMKRVTARGGLNTLHKYLLMQADYSACCKPNEDAQQKAFDEAIATAARAGFIQDAALANELAGDYFISTCDKYRPTYYLTRARDLYQEWGAHAKVNHLREKHKTLIKTSSTRSFSKQSQSLSHWLSGGDSKLHNSVDLDLLSGRSSTPQTVSIPDSLAI
jgi:predicted ATPase